MNARSKIDIMEATRLTRAGRLVEAMAVLRGLRPSGRPSDCAADATQGRRTPSILDVERPSMATGASWTSPQSGEVLFGGRREGIGRPAGCAPLQRLLDGLGDLGSARGLDGLVGDVLGRAPVPVPDGARFEERNYANEAGSRAYKLYVPSGYNTR